MPAFDILAWLANPANWLKLAAGVVVAGLLVFAGVQTARLESAKASLAKAQVKIQLQTDQAIVASGQAAADGSAAGIEALRLQSDASSNQITTENESAIQAAPGASQALNPALNRAGIAGLCRYPEYASDPECVGLLKGHSAVLPPASGAHAAP